MRRPGNPYRKVVGEFTGDIDKFEVHFACAPEIMSEFVKNNLMSFYDIISKDTSLVRSGVFSEYLDFLTAIKNRGYECQNGRINDPDFEIQTNFRDTWSRDNKGCQIQRSRYFSEEKIEELAGNTVRFLGMFQPVDQPFGYDSYMCFEKADGRLCSMTISNKGIIKLYSFMELDKYAETFDEKLTLFKLLTSIKKDCYEEKRVVVKSLGKEPYTFILSSNPPSNFGKIQLLLRNRTVFSKILHARL